MGKKSKKNKGNDSDNNVSLEKNLQQNIKQKKTSTKTSTVILSIISLISGFLIMVIELTSSRVLAPYYGNTIYCWTGVIGTILFAMSLGYLLGGILVEKYSDKEKLLRILLITSGLATSTIPFLAHSLAGFLAEHNSYTTGPIVGSLLIFCFPAFCFATIPPLCVKIISENVRMVGLASGIVSSTSAMGSILGTFCTGFYLIPNMSLPQIYYFSALAPFILLLLTFFIQNNFEKEHIVKSVIIFFIAIPMWFAYEKMDIFPNLDGNNKEVYKNLNSYHLARVYDKDYFYLLKLDSTNEGALTKEGSELVFEYTKYWNLVRCFKDENTLGKACFVGGGAFAIPTIFHKKLPHCEVDAIEIDPELEAIGRKFFHIDPDNKKFNVHIEDGRRWFVNKKEEYDFIFLDAFHGVRSIPHHLVTSEYFALLNKSLTSEGILAINIIASREGKKSLFYKAFLKTILEHFPTVFIFATNPDFATESNNLILFALKEKDPNLTTILRTAKKLNLYKFYRNKVDIFDKSYSDKLAEVPILTDEYAPVEYMVAQ